jgi:hypothetical protein
VALLVVAAIAAATLTGAAQQVSNTHRQVTLVLRGGQRHTGTLVYHNNANLNLIENGQNKAYPQGDIAVVEFASGKPAAAELNQLREGTKDVDKHMLALKDGTFVHGRMYTITSTAITMNTPRGHQNYDLNNVVRWYLNPDAAREAYR